MYIDVHCHLTGGDYESVGGVATVVERARAAGVERMICSGCDLDCSFEGAAIARQYESVYFCTGFHPAELKKYKEGDLERLESLCSDPKCVAVGEIGLDYHYEDNPPKEVQRELFIKQLEMAYRNGLPVVIHSRDAAGETLELLQQHQTLLKYGALLHCYSYSPEMAERFGAMGMYFSFGGPSTFKNARKVLESVQRIPATRILSETDCPFLTPEPHRGQFPNEPRHIPHITARLAQLKGMDEAEMQKQIYENAKRLFFKLQ
ncbi:MAG: TatD family hydrolase [Clostridia bacterium]|nr:TatD family hydrolase [Clostridia bacterium]